MPILNYTTTVDVSKTIAEVEILLVAHGARAFRKEYDQRRVVSAVFFEIDTGFGRQSFRLPVRTDGVLALLKSDPAVRKSHSIKRDEAQARRVAWRIIKDWIEAQLALIDCEMTTLSEVMLPYLELESGETLYHALENRRLALPSGE